MTQEEQDDIDFQIAFYEGIIRRRADFVQGLIALGDLYTKKGLYEKGLQIDKKLSQLKPDDPVVLYNLACSYSLLNKIDLALGAIKLAIQCGYDNLSHLEQDRDLENLLKDSRFQKYFTELKEEKPGSWR